MSTLSPRDILSLANVSTSFRRLALSQLYHVWDMRLYSTHCHDSKHTTVDDISFNLYTDQSKLNQLKMSDFELYIRLMLSELYYHENESPAETDCKEVVGMAVLCCKKILRRLYALDDVNRCQSLPLQNIPEILSPYLESNENLHVIPRAIADQVSRGICVPETAVLVLQCLASLHDQSTLQHVINTTGKDAQLRIPALMDRISFGVLCFEYLIPNIISLLQPSSLSIPPKSTVIHGGTESYNNLDRLQSDPQLLPPLLHTSNLPSSSMSKHLRNLTKGALQSQQELISPINIRSTLQLTRVLCFLPLLGRHFNALPTSTFIETFLDRSKGDIPIDRAAVMVYGFMCVLDLETGKANLTSESYKIFEKSMPTQGVVQAKEIIRMMERHRILIRGFLLSSPTFSSTHVF
ncbi:hypothetical protein BGZ76_005519 [Entomortierella beljakovae]|nr:hypothetical protein BGZ76_005519 [Entomortierella beljakovae]